MKAIIYNDEHVEMFEGVETKVWVIPYYVFELLTTWNSSITWTTPVIAQAPTKIRAVDGSWSFEIKENEKLN